MGIKIELSVDLFPFSNSFLQFPFGTEQLFLKSVDLGSKGGGSREELGLGGGEPEIYTAHGTEDLGPESRKPAVRKRT